MSDERGYGALPKLYGAPAYSRPRPAGIDTVSRPFDPDDLPLESQRTELDQQLVEEYTSPSYAAPAGGTPEQVIADDRGRGRTSFWRLPGRKG